MKKSGNRTVRVIADLSIDNVRGQTFLNELKNLQCSYEGAYSKLLSINIPPGINLDEVTYFLTGQDWIEWEYVDPTYEEITNEAEPN